MLEKGELNRLIDDTVFNLNIKSRSNQFILRTRRKHEPHVSWSFAETRLWSAQIPNKAVLQ